MSPGPFFTFLSQGENMGKDERGKFRSQEGGGFFQKTPTAVAVKGEQRRWSSSAL